MLIQNGDSNARSIIWCDYTVHDWNWLNGILNEEEKSDKQSQIIWITNLINENLVYSEIILSIILFKKVLKIMAKASALIYQFR